MKAPLLDLFSPEEDLSQGPWHGLADSLAAVRKAWGPRQGDFPVDNYVTAHQESHKKGLR